MICPVCNGHGETAPGMRCGACRATGIQPWPVDPADTKGAGLVSAADGGLLRAVYGAAVLDHGAAVVTVPDRFTPPPVVILLGCQEARGTVGGLYVSDRTPDGFTVCSTSERDESLVGWLIIG